MNTRFLISFAVACLFIGSTSVSNAQKLTDREKNSWLISPDKEYLYREFAPQLSFRVKPSLSEKAIRELFSVRIKPIQRYYAEYLVGNRVAISSKYKPYLVRGLYINDVNGGFYLKRRGGRFTCMP